MGWWRQITNVRSAALEGLTRSVRYMTSVCLIDNPEVGTSVRVAYIYNLCFPRTILSYDTVVYTIWVVLQLAVS